MHTPNGNTQQSDRRRTGRSDHSKGRLLEMEKTLDSEIWSASFKYERVRIYHKFAACLTSLPTDSRFLEFTVRFSYIAPGPKNLASLPLSQVMVPECNGRDYTQNQQVAEGIVLMGQDPPVLTITFGGAWGQKANLSI